MPTAPDGADDDDTQTDLGIARVGIGKSQRLIEIMAEHHEDTKGDAESREFIDPKGD